MKFSEFYLCFQNSCEVLSLVLLQITNYITLEKCKKECNIVKITQFPGGFVLSLELTTETTQTGPGIFIAQVFLLAREIKMRLQMTQ